MAARLLALDGAEEAEDVGKHETMRELRLVIKAVDLTTVLGQSGERNDVVEIEVEGRVDVLDQSLDVLLGG